MKMFKAVKKLKFWSKTKKRRKSLVSDLYYLSTSCNCHHCCYSTSSVQPSAPPLPSWLQAELTQDAIPPLDQAELFPELPYSTEDIVSSPTLPVVAAPEPTPVTSYQQYMVPSPVYGLPVVQTSRRSERLARFFGCVKDFGFDLIRWFCPCFRIREDVSSREL